MTEDNVIFFLDGEKKNQYYVRRAKPSPKLGLLFAIYGVLRALKASMMSMFCNKKDIPIHLGTEDISSYF
jgi:hypothetical protein